MVNFRWGLEECEDALDYDSILDTLESNFLGDLTRTHHNVNYGTTSFSRSGDYSYQGSRALRLEEVFANDRDFQEVAQSLECTVKADVNTRSRSVTNVEVVQGELVQDGWTLSTYP